MKHIGLFEGIGGFSLAARWIGWETIAWCEWNEFGQKVLNYHFPKAKGHGDITKTDFTIYRGQCDILTGGFPCQPYSVAGKRKGKDDDRHLWPEMLRAIREIQPSWVVGENVSGIVNWNGGMVFDEVQADLEAESYKTLPFLLPACAVNAPHRRDRVWFIAHSNKIGQFNRREQQKPNNESQYSWRNSEGNVTDTKDIGLQRGEQQRKERGIQEQSGRLGTDMVWDRWKNFPSEPPVCGANDGVPRQLDGITFSKWRNESIKAYGNAIVPQVAYQIFKVIQEMESKLLQLPQ